jgi:glycerol uptake facilitator protein
MNEFFAEFIGTMLMILLGNGVVANVNLNKTFGNSGGWIVITMGWGLGVFIGVTVAGSYSGAHLNPAVTLGFSIAGLFPWAKAAVFILAQLLGAAMGAFLVWAFYREHFNETDNQGTIRACYCTSPAIRKPFSNLICEFIGTFVLIFVIFYIQGATFEAEGVSGAKIGLGTIGAFPVAFLVVAIGLSLGGTTGYAINPARDLMPRIMHTILPMKFKGPSGWEYAYVPVVGPIAGAAFAAVLYLWLQ